MEEEASCPALMASNSEGSRKSRLTGNSGSSTSIKCRICQLTESETGEPVKTSDCRCKRDLASVHRSCLTDWVNYKGNNTCEVCKAPFANVPAPILTENIDGEQTIMTDLMREYGRLHPMTFRIRAILLSMLLFTLLIIVAVGIFLFVLMPGKEVDDQHFNNLTFPFLFSILCIMGVKFTCIAILWVTMEICFCQRRRAVHILAIRIANRNTVFPFEISGNIIEIEQ
ncbi:E3 ubiquitin-protein ligase MARCHF1-like isoform X4 [Gigantopelta aegis]|uniref:E3 ubiquitin-protein ligase MARCHF1-like isoform X4 n=1 Tax=Gigantopelta aegis TaxID=1735272 RepID=UPI001B88768A|nr:E3 ubiquitin-protein ligase MARCHF1-like isoform X4 [Gigantopelta aegis]